jgi:hypothetical protein
VTLALRQLPEPHELDWCLERIRGSVSSDATISAVHVVPSRLATVFRLVAATPSGEATFFLKVFETTDTDVELGERFRLFEQIGVSFEASQAVAPLRVVGCDPRRGLLLTMQTPGESLLDIHRRMTRRLGLGDITVALRGWRGLGEWLGILHWGTLPAIRSESRASELADYAKRRFIQWAAEDRTHAPLSDAAIDALATISRLTARDPLTLTLCHGDVSAGNVIVGNRVGLVDLDDMRFDMPGLDISQAMMELGEFAHVLSVLPVPGLRRRAELAFREGYARPLPDGPDFWLPHLRNLSVYLVTLARTCHGITLDRVTEEARYRRAQRELRRCIGTIRRSCSDR